MGTAVWAEFEPDKIVQPMKQEGEKMGKENNIEIERKFLIAYPDEAALAALPGARISDIVQTYLLSAQGERRVRLWRENGEVTYISTYKQKTGGLCRIEIEKNITREEYDALLETANPEMHPLHKRRYTIPYGAHTAEIDIYPFWNDRAILEIELSREDEEFDFPCFVTVIREVTGEKQYKNPVLARKYGG